MGSTAEITLADMVKVKRYISDIHGPQTAVADLAWQGGEGAPTEKKLQRPEWSLYSEYGPRTRTREPRAFFSEA